MSNMDAINKGRCSTESLRLFVVFNTNPFTYFNLSVSGAWSTATRSRLTPAVNLLHGSTDVSLAQLEP